MTEMMRECIFVRQDLRLWRMFMISMYTLDLSKPRKMGAYNKQPGGRLNKKDGLTRYGDSHVKDKTS